MRSSYWIPADGMGRLAFFARLSLEAQGQVEVGANTRRLLGRLRRLVHRRRSPSRESWRSGMVESSRQRGEGLT